MFQTTYMNKYILYILCIQLCTTYTHILSIESPFVRGTTNIFKFIQHVLYNLYIPGYTKYSMYTTMYNIYNYAQYVPYKLCIQIYTVCSMHMMFSTR